MKNNYHAIVLDKRDIGEMDRLYTFYTEEDGLVRTVARSVRKPEARMAAQVEDFTRVHVSIAKNGGRGTLAGAVAEHYHERLRGDFDALSEADRARGIFLALVREHDADARLYTLWKRYLEQMDAFVGDVTEESRARHLSVRWLTHVFLMQLYALLGYTFRVQVCAHCKTALADERRRVFSAHRGGVVCAACANGDTACRVDDNTLKALRMIAAHPLPRLRKVAVNDVVDHQLARIESAVARWIMR